MLMPDYKSGIQLNSAATRSTPVTVGSPRLECTNCDDDDFVNRVVRLRATKGKKSVTWRLPDRLLGDTDLLYRIIQLLIELDTTMDTRRRSVAVRFGYAAGLILATPVALAIRVTQVLFASASCPSTTELA
jgi:hypothetical protein